MYLCMCVCMYPYTSVRKRKTTENPGYVNVTFDTSKKKLTNEWL